MGYFGSEGIYDSNLSFWGKKFQKIFGPNATSGECTTDKFKAMNSTPKGSWANVINSNATTDLPTNPLKTF